MTESDKGNRCVIDSGREEERDLDSLPDSLLSNHCFGLVIVKEFKFVYCHPGFDVLNTGTSAWRGGNLGFDEGPQISGAESSVYEW